METVKKCSDKSFVYLLMLWLIEGIVVGFGAILPGVSGGALCVAFGMYRPIIETVNGLREGIKKNGKMLGIFIIGVIIGFVGLSKLASWLLEKNAVVITCMFVGFILGTIPELWHDSGEKGRNRNSYISMILGFLVMMVILILLKTSFSLNISPGISGYLLCGALWGLSFIVPGLSSSSLLLFFGLYQPMLEGISSFNFAVLIPLLFGLIICVLLLSKGVGYAYKKYYSAVSHGVLGIIVATAIMIVPLSDDINIAVKGIFIITGAVISYIMTRICDSLRNKTSQP